MTNKPITREELVEAAELLKDLAVAFANVNDTGTGKTEYSFRIIDPDGKAIVDLDSKPKKAAKKAMETAALGLVIASNLDEVTAKFIEVVDAES